MSWWIARVATRRLAAAIEADRVRQTLALWGQVRHAYGMKAYYANQAYNWWGWSL